MRAKSLLLGGFVLALLGNETWASEYFLYTPTSATKEKIAEKGSDEIAVREITVVKGDSLFRISRRYSGRGSYYPQILLFNDIKNPNLIHTGQTLRIPLPRNVKKSHLDQGHPPVAPPPITEERTSAPVKEAAPSAPAAITSPPVPSPPTKKSAVMKRSAKVTKKQPKAPAETEHSLFSQGVRAYKSGTCTAAVKYFDLFLASYPNSLLAADAALYRADCYLKQAGQ